MAKRGRKPSPEAVTPEKIDIELEQIEAEAVVVDEVPPAKADNVVVQYGDGYKCFLDRTEAESKRDLGLLVIVNED